MCNTLVLALFIFCGLGDDNYSLGYEHTLNDAESVELFYKNDGIVVARYRFRF